MRRLAVAFRIRCAAPVEAQHGNVAGGNFLGEQAHGGCLLYTSDAADERSSVDLGGRRIIKKKKRQENDAQSEVQK